MEGAAVVGSVWDEALAADRPVLVEAVVDPATPLTPPKLTDDQIGNLAAGLGAEESAEADRAYAGLVDQVPRMRRR
jgi:pyruvate dehydrogenase (quinone)